MTYTDHVIYNICVLSMISAGDQAERARRDHYSNLFCNKKVIKIPTNKIRFHHKIKQKKGGHNSDLSLENEYYRNKFASMKASGISTTDPAAHTNNKYNNNQCSDSDDSSDSESSSSSSSSDSDSDDEEESDEDDIDDGNDGRDSSSIGYASKSTGFTPAPPNTAYKTSMPFNHTQRNIK